MVSIEEMLEKGFFDEVKNATTKKSDKLFNLVNKFK